MDAGRKREFGCLDGELSYYSTSIDRRKTRRRIIGEPEGTRANKDPSTSHPSESSEGSADVSKETAFLSNLKEEQEKSFDKSPSAYGFDNCRRRRKTTPSSQVEAESFEQDSTTNPLFRNSSRRGTTEAKMPRMDEIEEFLSAAEKDLLKTSADKYNFDFEKEEPLEGRYEWVRLKA